jgi:hypothetical protein
MSAADHVVKERDFKEMCFYCMTPIDVKGWKSEFMANKHYKTITCGCGKVNKIIVGYEGSGHDSWHVKRPELASKAPLDVQVKAMTK